MTGSFLFSTLIDLEKLLKLLPTFLLLDKSSSVLVLAVSHHKDIESYSIMADSEKDHASEHFPFFVRPYQSNNRSSQMAQTACTSTPTSSNASAPPAVSPSHPSSSSASISLRKTKSKVTFEARLATQHHWHLSVFCWPSHHLAVT